MCSKTIERLLDNDNIEKIPVLVTNGWVRTTYCIMESLGKRGIPLHVVDRSKTAMCRFSKWTKSFHQVPNYYTEPEAYTKAVGEVAQLVGAKLVIPSGEDVIVLAKYQHLLPDSLRFIHPTYEKLNRANNKWDVMQLCKDLEVPHAASFIPPSLDSIRQISEKIKFPVVIKTRTGNAGKGVFIIEKKEDLFPRYQDTLQRFNIPREKWPMIQEYLGTDLCGVCMIYNKGKMEAAFCETYLRSKEENKFSTTTYRVSSYNAENIENCKKLADQLEWHGVIHFDLINDPVSGVGKVIEINPRFWGTLIVSVASGMDFPFMLYELALKGKIESVPVSYKQEVYLRWVLGEIIGILNTIKGSGSFAYKVKHVLDIFRSQFKGSTDDFRLSDPMVFLMELVDYGLRYRLTRSSNPAEQGMVG